jgi:hypothetical protein
MRRTLLSFLTACLSLAAPAWAADVEVQLGAGDGFVIKDNTDTIERLRVDEATGNISRNGELFVHTTGTNSTFVGEGAGNTATTGLFNSAFGKEALMSNTEGIRNSALGHRALRFNTTASDNSAFGNQALNFNTASRNSAFGSGALLNNSAGADNSAFGDDALARNTTGNVNSAFGARALDSNMTGLGNAAFGFSALHDNTTGQRNVAIGSFAGASQDTGSDNIYIASRGVSGESGQIKIGTSGTHTDAFIAGIDGNVVAGSVVHVTASGQLGVAASSARFKHDVHDMAAASNVLMDLRPVTFLYRDEVSGANDERQYGLLSEEVAKAAPDLVRFDDAGTPFSVHYEQLAPMLVNEMQKQQRTIEGQATLIEEQRVRLELEAERNGVQEARMTSLLARLDALESQLGSGRPGTGR